MSAFFPQIACGFIAIKEHYDNFDTDGSNESLMIPLQNMINALYSKDISRKVSTALKAQMEQGTFQKRNLPYGYRWNEDHTNMVIDEETAPYVRLMFQWKIEGWSIPMILNELDRLVRQIRSCGNARTEPAKATAAPAKAGTVQRCTAS